ncbi:MULTISPECIES: hypothetical protein [Elizabethkingia]|uniref:Lipoprotein n=2 Tax=Elizabethkingia anophelis TaxID=1117645 RepID=A0A455ZFR9_9FLAO|nr:hypothetical protein [Elizabethkingia anophelis]ATC37766.1 hypothetical protein BAZ09_016615 [Elizabethkingia anophelis R26]ATC41446.1 hypothetical protein EAAG1_016830 [Elizabethkingia anophelis Ag1]ATC45123.1 hypothetical protein CMV41_16830 [Elizabethkingia anophelis]ATC48799.1 hypothetical protein CMV40_16830 [Elizabethkingia anophelis]ELR80750.1 putative lipoprotein [Elizabethkingia anophelis R26]
MKKSLLAFAFGGAILATTISCDRNNDTQIQNDQDTVALVTEINVTFRKENFYAQYEGFKSNINNGDNVLIYRLDGVSNGKNVWHFIPRTYYVSNSDNTVQKEIDFNYDFSVSGVTFTIGGTFNKNNPESFVAPYLSNQRFRAVIVPGNMAAQASSSNKVGVSNLPVNYQDYDAVAKYYNIKESDVKILR